MDSIDIFDTALFRKVYEPKDIFRLIEKEVGKDFYNKRIQAEQEAAKKYECYNIHQIYEFLPEFNINYELILELNNIYANPEILEMYNKDPKNYVFISDMYLSTKYLESLLKLNGYIDPKVYVSCDCKAHKGDGSLFKYVLKKYKINKHYGDNYICDVVKAKENGIEPVFLPSLQNRDIKLPVIKNPLLKKYLANTYKYDAIEKLAIWYTPLIYEFTKWCLLNREPGQTLYFLSRDMYLPYLVAKSIFKADNIKYLYISRRSISALILQKSLDKKLKDHICEILSPEELEEKRYEDITSCINYLSQIKNNDIIVDIGYSGTIQAALQCLGINTQGLYIQVNHNPYNVIMKSFFTRSAFQYLLPMEFILGSPEDSIETYNNDKPVFVSDNEIRKEYARRIKDIVLDNIEKVMNFNVNIFDIEQMIIHLQYYPDKNILELFNSKIFTNRERVESCIGFDRDEILKGNLFELYQKSYARPLFKQLLEQDVELAYLSKLLP